MLALPSSCATALDTAVFTAAPMAFMIAGSRLSIKQGLQASARASTLNFDWVCKGLKQSESKIGDWCSCLVYLGVLLKQANPSPGKKGLAILQCLRPLKAGAEFWRGIWGAGAESGAKRGIGGQARNTRNRRGIDAE